MSNLQCPTFLLQTEKGDLFAYWDPIILRMSLCENKDQKVRVFSRHFGGGIVRYAEVSCMQCFDHDDKCQECCPHDEYDHGMCLVCDKDCTDDLVGAAEAYYEGDR